MSYSSIAEKLRKLCVSKGWLSEENTNFEKIQQKAILILERAYEQEKELTRDIDDEEELGEVLFELWNDVNGELLEIYHPSLKVGSSGYTKHWEMIDKITRS